MVIMDYNKYENYIKVGHNATLVNGEWVCSDLSNFPTPSAIGRTLHDVDLDAYTDLQGYTQRNRVRHDVEDIELQYSILSDADEQFILDRISPQWIFVELMDKKTRTKKVHKMYASDKSWSTFRIKKVDNVWREEAIDFTFSLVEQ